MIENRFNILASKYLTGELADDERLELESLISTDSSYKQMLKEYVSVGVFVDEHKSSLKSDVYFKKFSDTVEKRKKRLYTKKLFNYAAAVAAIVLVIFGSNFIITNYKSNPRTALVIPDENIILYNESGTPKIIGLNNATPIKNRLGKAEGIKIGNEIIYRNRHKASLKSVNHTLKIPFGKKFKVTLSDGTKVHLNSGSTFTYPSDFSQKSKRIVHLIGEAYFEIAKNPKKPFIVKTSSLNIRALGTKFNVSSYKNDKTNSVLLEEGSVAVNSYSVKSKKAVTLILKPRQKAMIKKIDSEVVLLPQKTISINDVVKTTSWKNSELIFENDKFIDITKKLERHFNVKIVSENKKLNEIEFTGRFTKQDVFDVLDAFRVHTSFKYSVHNNTIVIK